MTSAALAQDPGGQTSAVEDSQKPAGSREAPTSFEALPLTLKVGQRIIVREESGRTTRGKVVSISDDQVVIGDVFVRRWSNLWSRPRREEHAVGSASVTRIDTVDSVWNGAVIGAAVGVGTLASRAPRFLWTVFCEKENELCPRENSTRRWSARRKVSVVIEFLKGESLEILSRRHEVTAAKLSQWRDHFLAGGEARLKHREVVVDDEDTRRLKSVVADLATDKALLAEKIRHLEAGRPLGWWRAKR